MITNEDKWLIVIQDLLNIHFRHILRWLGYGYIGVYGGPHKWAIVSKVSRYNLTNMVYIRVNNCTKVCSPMSHVRVISYLSYWVLLGKNSRMEGGRTPSSQQGAAWIPARNGAFAKFGCWWRACIRHGKTGCCWLSGSRPCIGEGEGGGGGGCNPKKQAP